MSDSTFVTHVLDLLEPLGPSRARAMMGGHMIACCGLTVALISDEQLYLKIDAATKDVFVRAGGEPFSYDRNGKRVEMSYWTLPDDALDDAEGMRPWATLALAAAGRAKKGKGTASSTARTPPPRRRAPPRTRRAVRGKK
jgi:DNA transformation protein and related proteins